jgi:hypothetical protein
MTNGEVAHQRPQHSNLSRSSKQTASSKTQYARHDSNAATLAVALCMCHRADIIDVLFRANCVSRHSGDNSGLRLQSRACRKIQIELCEGYDFWLRSIRISRE